MTTECRLIHLNLQSIWLMSDALWSTDANNLLWLTKHLFLTPQANLHAFFLNLPLPCFAWPFLPLTFSLMLSCLCQDIAILPPPNMHMPSCTVYHSQLSIVSFKPNISIKSLALFYLWPVLHILLSPWISFTKFTSYFHSCTMIHFYAKLLFLHGPCKESLSSLRGTFFHIVTFKNYRIPNFIYSGLTSSTCTHPVT